MTKPTNPQGHSTEAAENLAAPTLPPLKGSKRDGSMTREERKAWHGEAVAQVMREEHARAAVAPAPELLEASAAIFGGPNGLATASTDSALPVGGETAAGGGGKAVMGRPSEYTPEEGDVICAWIANGKSLISYCKAKGRAMDTVYRWLRTRADFRENYTQAHEDRADTLADEMLDIADDPRAWDSIEAAQGAKLRVETRKWIASKLRPQKWGEKQVIEHGGNVSIRIGIPQKPATDNAIDVTPKPLPL